MGGRGSSFGTEVISARSIKGESGEVKSLNVAGMTPTEQGSRYTNTNKTLAFIEKQKLEHKEEQLQVIDRHGYVTRAFQGDEHSVAVDLETRTYMKGKVVTHNHPSVYGGTFSDADINCLKMGMKELRASAKEGTYSMKATKMANSEAFYDAYCKDAGKMQREMNKISIESAKKKWRSYDDYQYANRKEQLAVIDGWYRKNAEKYGYKYDFEPRKE